MPRRYSLGKREPSVARTRSAIIGALLRLMARAPYDTITIKQVAAEADVAEKTVHRHFPSKHAIFVVWTQGVSQAARVPVVESTNGQNPRSAVEGVSRALHGVYEEHKDHIWAFVVASSTSEEIARYRDKLRRFGDSLASSVVDAWPDAWRLDQERTRQILAGLLRFLTWKVLREGCGLSAEEAVFAITEVVTRVLMKRGAWEVGALTGASD